MTRQTKWAALLAAMALVAVAQAAPVSGQGTWETTLRPRDLDSNRDRRLLRHRAQLPI